MDTGDVARTRALRSSVSPIFLAFVGVAALGGVLTVLPAGGAVVGGTVLLVLAGWAVSLCLHEFGHAYTAYRLGDESVKAMGYLTLDIRRYTNIGLTLVLPLLILIIGGIPLPGGSVWIQRGALRSRPAQSAVSLAGPVVNLVLALVLAVAVSAVAMPVHLAAALSFLALLQILTGVLNLLPVPGLDGYGVIDPYLPYPVRLSAARIAPWAPLVIILAIFFLPGVSQLVFAPAYAGYAAMGGDPDLAGLGYQAFTALLRGGSLG